MNLIQELYNNGFLNKEKMMDLQLEVEKTGQPEEEIIIKHNIIDEDALFKLKSKFTGVEFFKPKPQEIPLDVLELISQEAATNYKMIPLFKKDNVIGIGMVYPENILAQNALRFLSRKANFTYQTYLISFSDLQNALKQHRTLKRETKKALNELSSQTGPNPLDQSKELASVNGDDQAPIIKMVLVILRHALEGNASDIHIEPNREKLNVRFRQDGVLHLSLFLPLSVHLAIVSRIKILANLKIDENRIPQDGRFSVRINEKDIDFRVATFPTLYGEKVELRVLDPVQGVKSLKEMGLSERNIQIITEAVQKPYGLILSTGPTGSGKTTTLYALLKMLNKETVNIVTLEDPIEYSIDGINQSQVKPQIGYTFAEGLRQILRQDPNVIMVGEMRDEETAALAINSALTGHVVLSTLHTNSATGAIPRLIDMGTKPFLIPSTLRLVISQRLIRTLCNTCKKKVKLTDKVKAYMVENIKTIPLAAKKDIAIDNPMFVYEANGCQTCNFKGYKGRIGLYEVLVMTDELAEIILKNPVESVILKTAQKQGMLTMAQEGIIKVLAGETSLDEVTRATNEEK